MLPFLRRIFLSLGKSPRHKCTGDLHNGYSVVTQGFCFLLLSEKRNNPAKGLLFMIAALLNKLFQTNLSNKIWMALINCVISFCVGGIWRGRRSNWPYHSGWHVSSPHHNKWWSNLVLYCCDQNAGVSLRVGTRQIFLKPWLNGPASWTLA